MKRNQVKRKKNNRSRKGGRKAKGESDSDIALALKGRQYVRLRDAGAVVPEAMVVPFHFYSSYVMTNNGGAYTNLRWHMNSAYDVDPLVGSTAIAGFTEITALYGSYRVIGCKATFEFTNNEAFAVQLYAGPYQLNVDPTGNNLHGVDWLMNKDFKQTNVSAAGGMDKGKIVLNMSFPKLYSKQVLTDDSFAGAATGSPGLGLWCVFGALPPGAKTFTTAGVSVFAHLEMTTILYSRFTLTT